MRFSPSAAVLPLLLLLAAPAAAQEANVLGRSQSSATTRLEQYRARTLREVLEVMERWQNAWQTDDLRRIESLYTDDATLYPARGDVLHGEDGVHRHFAELLPRAGVATSQLLDFDTSGDLAYLVLRFAYTEEAAGTTRIGFQGRTFLVLERAGRSWRIRSQIERPEPADTSAAE